MSELKFNCDNCGKMSILNNPQEEVVEKRKLGFEQRKIRVRCQYCSKVNEIFFSSSRSESSLPLAKDIPILGDFLESILTYFNTTFKLIKNRSSFLEDEIFPLDEKCFKKSMNYFSLGIAASFIFLVPFFISHHESASKFIFILRQVIAIILYSAFMYFAFLILGVKKANFRSIAIVQGYLWGLLFPLNFLLMLPILISIGPRYIFSGYNIGWVSDLDSNTLLQFMISGILGGIAFIVIWLRYILLWLSEVLEISKGKVIAGILLGGLPSGLLIGFVLGPSFDTIERILSDWLMAV